MKLNEFCDLIETSSISEIDKAVSFIWFEMTKNQVSSVELNRIVELFEEALLARPNSSRLHSKLKADKRLLPKANGGNVAFAIQRETLKEFNQSHGSRMNILNKPLNQHAEQLRLHISKNLPSNTRAFLEEAVGCLENNFKRAAVVLSWQGALSIVQNYVVNKKLSEFNVEALSRKLIKNDINSVEQLQRIQEADQLICFEAIQVISKSVKSSLIECLNRRNNCGHPNDFKIRDGQVAGHLEILHDHVFAVFC
jgi:hypothetical protein